MSGFEEMSHRVGIMPSQWIREAIPNHIITSNAAISPEQIQPNSLDLRLDAQGYRVQCSFLPGLEGLQKKLSRYKWYEVPLTREGTVLECNQVYVFPLCEHLALPP